MAWMGLMLLAAGCSTTGNNFDSTRLEDLYPGTTTYGQTARIFGAAPTTVYRQSDGTLLARWDYKVTFMTDGFYGRKIVTLQFDPDGRLLRLVDSTNVLLEPWVREKLIGPPPLGPAPFGETMQ
jgi:methyl-accepting chemotaxis protein-1 (serine sensor receptor)